MKNIYARFTGTSQSALMAKGLLSVLVSLCSFVASAQSCPPVSRLSCVQVSVSLPYSLDFSGSQGGLPDKNGVGTGFTMADPPSSPLTPPSEAAVPGFEPSLIEVTGGRLQVRTTPGIAYLKPSASTATNSQVNALGVGVAAATQKLNVEGAVLQPPAGTNNGEQGGLWFGLDEDNYIKLVVLSAEGGQAQVELRREVNSLSGNADRLITGNLSLSSQNVRLRLLTDPGARTVEGFYALGSGTEVSLGKLSVPAGFFSGRSLGSGTEATTFAGLFATHRRASTALTYSFDNFRITAEAPPVLPPAPGESVRINFQPADAPAVAGYTADTGLGYSDSRGFGWLDGGTRQPKANNEARLRTSPAPAELLTLNHLQHSRNPNAVWEHKVANGTYRVTVAAGDAEYFDSQHTLRVEGVAAISGFVPSASQPFRTATATVTVQDGRLTVDAQGGVNAKINYIRIEPVVQQQVRINFQPADAPAVAGYTADTGLGYSDSRGFGWLDGGTRQPKANNEARLRASPAPAELLTLNHLQHSRNPNAVWEHKVANGTYRVTVAAGDAEYFDSQHTLRVEGVAVISGFVPSASQPFRTATAAVTVQDGRLTVDAQGGVNAKINFISWEPATPLGGLPLLAVENLDRFPADNHLVFSRIQLPHSRDRITYNANHDLVTLRLHNKGHAALEVNNLVLSAPTAWRIEALRGGAYNPSTSLPLTIPAGAHADVAIRFVAQNLAPRVKVLHETLSLLSTSAQQPDMKVFLHGLYQYRGEGDFEPYAQEVVEAFGFKTNIGFPALDPDRGDPSKVKGDEVPAAYFVRADQSKPVTVRQIAAYHGCCITGEAFQWHQKGSTARNTLFTHVKEDGQTLMPRKGLPDTPAEGSFSPFGSFGIIVNNDWTDPNFNPNKLVGVKVWKVRDGNGNVVPNAFLIGNDYLGTTHTNYDYNDNMYYVVNVQPEAVTSSSQSMLAGEVPEKLRVYPVPFKDQFTLALPQGHPAGTLSLTLLDLNGKAVHVTEQPVEVGQTTLQVSTASLGLSRGVYFLKVEAKDRSSEMIRLLID